MTGLASEQVGVRIARDGTEPAAQTALDPTQRALILMSNHGFKLVKAGNRRSRQIQFRLSVHLLLLKFRYFYHKSLSAVLFGFCRLLGEPK
jgi:hypothetical protein